MGGVNLEIGMIKEIVAKALDGQRYPCPDYVGCASEVGGREGGP